MTTEKDDPKVEALRAERSLNPHPEAVTDELFVSSGFMDARDVVQVKYEMVRRVQVDGETSKQLAAVDADLHASPRRVSGASSRASSSASSGVLIPRTAFR